MAVGGLGSLINRIGNLDSKNPTIEKAVTQSSFQQCNATKSVELTSLTQINNKPLFYRSFGTPSRPPIVFVHGLGGTSDFYTPLIQALGLENSHTLHLFDLEGHGLSPSSPLSKISIDTIADDIHGVFDRARLTPDATLIAHSMGCLAAVQFALKHPDKISKLILIGPPPSPLPEAMSTAVHGRAEIVRSKGMHAVVDAVATAGTSDTTKKLNPLAVAAVRMSLLGQDPEGYARGCTALAEAKPLNFTVLQSQTLIITGSHDKVSSPHVCQGYTERIVSKASLRILDDVGHWHLFEDLQNTASAVQEFL